MGTAVLGRRRARIVAVRPFPSRAEATARRQVRERGLANLLGFTGVLAVAPAGASLGAQLVERFEHVLPAQAPQDLAGQRQVVGAPVRPVVEDRHRSLCRLGNRRSTVGSRSGTACPRTAPEAPRACVERGGCACLTMLRQTPSSSRSGLRLSLARSRTWTALLHPLEREVLSLGGEDRVAWRRPAR